MRQVNATATLAVQTAREALTAGRYEPGNEVRDALADLLHYCDANGIDFDDELRIARANHEEERT